MGMVFCGLGIALIWVRNVTLPFPGNPALPPQLFDEEVRTMTTAWYGIYGFLVVTGIVFLILGIRAYSRRA